MLPWAKEQNQNDRPFSKGVHAILQLEQIKDLQKELEVGNWLYALGSDLENMKMTMKTLFNLEKLDSHHSKQGKF